MKNKKRIIKKCRLANQMAIEAKLAKLNAKNTARSEADKRIQDRMKQYEALNKNQSK